MTLYVKMLEQILQKYILVADLIVQSGKEDKFILCEIRLGEKKDMKTEILNRSYAMKMDRLTGLRKIDWDSVPKTCS